MTLKKGFVLSQRLAKKQKDVRYAGKYGAIVNEVLKTEEGKTNLNQQREITELHNMVQDLAEGGIYKNELRELSLLISWLMAMRQNIFLTRKDVQSQKY